MKQMAHSLKIFLASRYVRVGSGVALSGLCLYLAVQNVAYQDIWGVFARVDPGFLGLALLSVAINTFAKAVRWKVLIGPAGNSIRFSKILFTLLIGQMLNNLFPARVGEISRAYTIGSMGPGRIFIFGTVVLEKVLDMLSYALLFALLFLLMPPPPWIGDSAYTLTASALVGCGTIIFLVFQRTWLTKQLRLAVRWIPARFRDKTTSRLQSGLTSLDVLQRRTDLLWLGLWSVVIWGTAILTNHLVLLALHIHIHPTAALLILIVLQAGIALPSVPGKIGVFEYGCVLALAAFGVEQSLAFSYGVMLHAIVLLPTTLTGLFFFWISGLNDKRIPVLRTTEENETML